MNQIFRILPRSLRSYLFCCVALSFGSMAHADDKGFYVFPHAAIVDYKNESQLKSDELYGITVGYRHTGPLAIEADYASGDTSLRSGMSRKVDVDIWSVRGLYYFGESDTFRPFFNVGVGENDIDLPRQKRELQANAGLGLRLNLWHNLDLRAAFNFFDGDSVNGLERALNVGLHYRFGDFTKQVAHVPADTDADGVIDTQDRCLGTVAGIEVDVFGCEVVFDEDEDGIEDSLDQCLGTMDATRSIDSNGCYVEEVIIVAEELVMVPEEIEVTFYFAINSSAITPQHRIKAAQIADFLEGGEQSSVVVTGYTDNTGSVGYNQQLSLKRADAVKQLLLSETMVPSNRIDAGGLGENDPAAPNQTAAARAENRRVTAVVRTNREVLIEL